MPTDTERLDFIEKMLVKKGIGQGYGASINRNSLIGSQPNMEQVPVQIFTIPSQHQYGKTAREVIDRAMQFESGLENQEKHDSVAINRQLLASQQQDGLMGLYSYDQYKPSQTPKIER